MSDTWKTEPLGKHCYIKARIGWRGLASSEYTEDGPFLIAGKHVENGVINWESCDHITDFRYKESSEIALSQGDVILTKDGTIGRVARVDFLPGEATINGTMMLLRPLKGLNYRYLYHVLNGHRFKKLVDDKVSGSSIPHIFQRDMVTLPISLPPETQQVAIADVLDSLDFSIQQTQAIITKLKSVKQGLLHDLLTRGIDSNGELRPPQSEAPHLYKPSQLGLIPKEWVCEKIGASIDIEHGYAFSGKEFSDSPVGPKLLVPGNFHRDGGLYFSESNTKYFGGKYSNQFLLKTGDLLIVMTDLSPMTLILGKTVILRDQDEILHNQRIGKIVLKNRDDWSPEFFNTSINQDSIRRKIIATATGTTVRHTSPDRICECYIARPKVPEQMAISSRVATVFEKESKEQEELKKLVSMKNALMDDLLTGKVRVTPLLEKSSLKRAM